jgi:two-component system chemotaxis sensor kinase CheA
LEILGRPGFSTWKETDLAAGRGVGLDVVMKAVRGMGGVLSMDTAPGEGTTFNLQLPLTVTIIDALIVRVGSERYAVPRSMVDKVVEVDSSQIVEVEGGELYPYQDGSLSLKWLAKIFRIDSYEPNFFYYGLVSNLGDKRSALLVDKVIGLGEIVVRPIQDPLITSPGITGVTELGDGSIILILDMPVLVREMKGSSSGRNE